MSYGFIQNLSYQSVMVKSGQSLPCPHKDELHFFLPYSIQEMISISTSACYQILKMFIYMLCIYICNEMRIKYCLHQYCTTVMSVRFDRQVWANLRSSLIRVYTVCQHQIGS